MQKVAPETEENSVNQTTPAANTDSGDTQETKTVDENNPASKPKDTDTSTGDSSSDANSEKPPRPDPANGKYGRNFADPVKPNEDKSKRNEFLKKEYVDTYDKEKAYDEANSEKDKQEILAQMGSNSPGDGNAAPGDKTAPGGDTEGGEKKSGLAEMLQSDKMGNMLEVSDASSDVASLGFGISDMKGGSEKNSNIASIVTNLAGLLTGGVSTYRDVKDAQAAKRGGNKGELHSNNLSVAADLFGMGSNATGVVGSSLKAAGLDEDEISGKVGDSLGAVGNILSMSGSADRVRRQNSSLSKLRAIKNSDTASAEEKALAKNYSKATKAKRWASGFETGAGVANTIASGFSLAGDFVGNEALSSILSVVGTVIGLLGRGLSLLGGKLEDRRKSKNKDSIVDAYVAEEKNKVERHGSVDAEGELTDIEKENIAIARMGLDVSEFTEKSQKQTLKDEIFRHIGDIRVDAAKRNPKLLNVMGLADNASDEVIRDALGFEE